MVALISKVEGLRDWRRHERVHAWTARVVRAWYAFAEDSPNRPFPVDCRTLCEIVRVLRIYFLCYEGVRVKCCSITNINIRVEKMEFMCTMRHSLDIDLHRSFFPCTRQTCFRPTFHASCLPLHAQPSPTTQTRHRASQHFDSTLIAQH